MRVLATATIGEIAASAREAQRLFDNLGVDYACHGNLPLADACAELHLDPDDVLRALQRLEPEHGPDSYPLDVPLPLVVRELIGAQFPAMRYHLQQVGGRVEELCSALHVQAEPAMQLRKAFDDLAGRLGDHLIREQAEVLPRLMSVSSADREAVARQLAEMVGEHQAIATAVESVRSAMPGSEPLHPACLRIRAALRELESEIRQHMHIENNVLFPRVLPPPVTPSPRG